MGRQHQGMDSPGVRQVPEGSGDQGQMEETGCEIICGAQNLIVADVFPLDLFSRILTRPPVSGRVAQLYVSCKFGIDVHTQS